MENTEQKPVVKGAGLGLRRDFSAQMKGFNDTDVDFFEVAPENWIGVGGRFKKHLQQCTERFPLTLHGLSLDIGGVAPLNTNLLQDIKRFMDQYNCALYSEHLTYCGDAAGQLYDLMPIPFTEEAVHYAAKRVRKAQDILGRTMALENASYYATPSAELSELEFINAVIDESGCDLLLDVNNIYVNSVNHGYDAEAFLRGLPGHKAHYIHVAGHFNEAEDLRVDTHGADVIDPVWSLLQLAYQEFGPLPTLLERDFNIPPIPELLTEVQRIREMQQQCGAFVATAESAR